MSIAVTMMEVTVLTKLKCRGGMSERECQITSGALSVLGLVSTLALNFCIFHASLLGFSNTCRQNHPSARCK